MILIRFTNDTTWERMWSKCRT